MSVKRRDIAVSIVLTIVTCGIYGLYWMACITDDVNYMLNEGDTTGGMTVLLTIVTCGIYGIYWAYKLGEKLSRIKIKMEYDFVDSNTSILYLILSIFGFSIIVYALAQSDINKMTSL